MRKGVRLTASLLMSTLCGCQLSFHAGSDVAVSELMDQLLYDGFTQEQSEYGLASVGY